MLECLTENKETCFLNGPNPTIYLSLNNKFGLTKETCH